MNKEYKFFRTLEEFEGPILEEIHSEKGEVFVQKWADFNIYVLAKTTTKRIKAYMNQKISMYDLMFEFNEEVMIHNEKENTVKTIKVSEIPESYLPQKSAMHDPTLNPENN